MSDISDKFFVEEIERLKAENFELENSIKNSRKEFILNFVGFEECVIGTKYIIEFTANGFKVEKYEE